MVISYFYMGEEYKVRLPYYNRKLFYCKNIEVYAGEKNITQQPGINYYISNGNFPGIGKFKIYDKDSDSFNLSASPPDLASKNSLMVLASKDS